MRGSSIRADACAWKYSPGDALDRVSGPESDARSGVGISEASIWRRSDAQLGA
jgi:hypothetical protein